VLAPLLGITAVFAVLIGGLYTLARWGRHVRDHDEMGVDTGETFAALAEFDPAWELDRVHRACLVGLDDVLMKALHQLLPAPTERDWFFVNTGEYALVGVT